MPKIKTNKSAAKRFKITRNGKIKRNKAFKRHLLGHKTAKRRRNLRGSTIVDKADTARIRDMLPYA